MSTCTGLHSQGTRRCTRLCAHSRPCTGTELHALLPSSCTRPSFHSRAVAAAAAAGVPVILAS
eukprot:495074-Pleurochrysis_carterae.AAC.1